MECHGNPRRPDGMLTFWAMVAILGLAVFVVGLLGGCL